MGWQEDVTTNKGGPVQFKYINNNKTWADAEVHCQVEGGHLASVLSKRDQVEIRKLGGSFAGSTMWKKKVWIGGSDRTEEGVCRWVDGSPWQYTNWRKGYGKQGNLKNCAFLYTETKAESQYENGWTHPPTELVTWVDSYCDRAHTLVCQSENVTITGSRTMILT